MNQEIIEDIFYQYFEGDRNFVTPIVYGYEVLVFDEGSVLLEKSRNDSESIFGVSALFFNPVDMIVKRIELSECFVDSSDVVEYIESIDYDDFIHARRYGVEKRINVEV